MNMKLENNIEGSDIKFLSTANDCISFPVH